MLFSQLPYYVKNSSFILNMKENLSDKESDDENKEKEEEIFIPLKIEKYLKLTKSLEVNEDTFMKFVKIFDFFGVDFDDIPSEFYMYFINNFDECKEKLQKSQVNYSSTLLNYFSPNPFPAMIRMNKHNLSDFLLKNFGDIMHEHRYICVIAFYNNEYMFDKLRIKNLDDLTFYGYVPLNMVKKIHKRFSKSSKSDDSSDSAKSYTQKQLEVMANNSHRDVRVFALEHLKKINKLTDSIIIKAELGEFYKLLSNNFEVNLNDIYKTDNVELLKFLRDERSDIFDNLFKKKEEMIRHAPSYKAYNCFKYLMDIYGSSIKIDKFLKILKRWKLSFEDFLVILPYLKKEEHFQKFTMCNDTRIIEFLMKNKLISEVKDLFCMDEDLVNLIYDNGFTYSGYPPNNVKAIKLLISKGANLNIVVKYSYDFFSGYAPKYSLDCIEYMISLGFKFSDDFIFQFINSEDPSNDFIYLILKKLDISYFIYIRIKKLAKKLTPKNKFLLEKKFSYYENYTTNEITDDYLMIENDILDVLDFQEDIDEHRDNVGEGDTYIFDNDSDISDDLTIRSNDSY